MTVGYASRIARRCILCVVVSTFLLVAVVIVTGVAFVATIIEHDDQHTLAGPGSVYIPGAGFAGFWYHFGYFSHQLHSHQQITGSNTSKTVSLLMNQNRPYYRSNGNNTYYCYSSGCLGYVLAAASVEVDSVLQAAELVQQQWLRNEIHRYEVVPIFLQNVVPSFHSEQQHHSTKINETAKAAPSDRYTTGTSSSTFDELLSKLRILVTIIEPTTSSLGDTIWEGTQMNVFYGVRTPMNYKSLLQHLRQTTHIPWLTGSVRSQQQNNDDISRVVVDGGFSRWSHPVCNLRVDVPVTWTTMMHSLNPGLNPSIAKDLFRQGMSDAAVAAFTTDSDSKSDITTQLDHNLNAIVTHHNEVHHYESVSTRS